MRVSHPKLEYKTALPRRSRTGFVFLTLSAISAITCVGLLYGAEHNYYRLTGAGLCGFVVWAFARAGKQRRIPVLKSFEALNALVKRTGMPISLYLRRFSDDKLKEHPSVTEDSGHSPDEEELAVSLAGICLFVAAGRPGEPLPPWGAYRLYISDEEWEKQVRDLISISSLVLFKWGHSEPLRKEIHMVQEESKLHRTMFLLPPLDSFEHIRTFLPDDLYFDIDTFDPPDNDHYAAFFTITEDGKGHIHFRDRKLNFGEAARLVAADIIGITGLTKEQRRTVRGFYGKTERFLSTMLILCLYTFSVSLAVLMLTVLSIPIITLLPVRKFQDTAMLIVDLLLTVDGWIVVISLGLLLLLAVMSEKIHH